LVSY
jgi:hypothetical protein